MNIDFVKTVTSRLYWCSIYRHVRALEECICAHTHSVSLQCDIANDWPGMRNTALLVIVVVWTGIVLTMLSSVHETSKDAKEWFAECFLEYILVLT